MKLTDFNSPEEVEGCAKGLGIASILHLDPILTSLRASLKPQSPPKKKGWFAFGGSAPAPTTFPVQNLVVRAWGWISGYASSDLIASRMDSHITTNLIPIMRSAKEERIQVSVAVGVERIAISLKENEKATFFVLKSRDEMVRNMMSYLKSGSTKLKAQAQKSISKLVRLQPLLKDDGKLRRDVLEAALPQMAERKPKSEDEKDPVLEQTQQVLLALLETSSVEGLCMTLFKLHISIVSKKPHERRNSLDAYLVLIKRFMSLLRKGMMKGEGQLDKIGHFLATIIPRITDDAEARIRRTAMDIVQMLLYIDQLCRNPDQETPSEALKTVTQLKKLIVDAKIPEDRHRGVSELAAILCELVSEKEMTTLLEILIPGINDTSEEAAYGTAQMLKGLLKGRANETSEYVERLLDVILGELKKLSKDSPVLDEVLGATCLLGEAHFNTVMSHLMGLRLPVSREAKLIYCALAADERLTTQVVDRLLEVINTNPIQKLEITPLVCVATSAFSTILSLPAMEGLLAKYYFTIFATLVTRVGTAAGKLPKGKGKAATKKKKKKDESKKNDKKDKKEKKDKREKKEKPGGGTDEKDEEKKEKETRTYAKEAVRALRRFCETAKELHLLKDLETHGVWHLLERDRYEEGLAEFIRHYCEKRPQSVVDVFESLKPFLNKTYLGQRNATVVTYAELIRHQKDDELLNNLVNTMLPRISDQEKRIRERAVIGLGNLMDIWHKQDLSKSASAILNAVTCAMEDNDFDVARAAIHSSNSVLTVIDEEVVGPALIQLCFRTKPFLDKKQKKIRVLAYDLFTTLCRFGVGKNRENFLEQVHTNMATFVVHLNEDKEVSARCLICFQRVAEYLENKDLIDVLETVVPGAGSYDQMIAKVAPILVTHYHERLPLYLQQSLGYFKSKWESVRGNAAVFSAKIVACVEHQKLSTIDVKAVSDEIMRLLKQPKPIVRSRAAKALSYMSML